MDCNTERDFREKLAAWITICCCVSAFYQEGGKIHILFLKSFF
jgi:hypothetical protein